MLTWLPVLPALLRQGAFNTRLRFKKHLAGMQKDFWINKNCLSAVLLACLE